MALIYDRNLWSRQAFDPSCPSGGSWFACTTGSRFVGCCTGDIDPCNATTSCPQKNLKPASFDTSKYGTFADQSCDANSKWYTCAGTDPAFMGCCKSNPCSTGCPTKNLTAASLSLDDAKASGFTMTSVAATSTAASTTSTSAATSAAATTSAASAISAVAFPSSKDHAGAIAGGVVGGVAGLALIFIGILWWFKRIRKSRQKKLEQEKLETSADNNDGYFHENLHPRREEAPTTGYSQENPEGIEVDNRPVYSPDPHLSVDNQDPNINRPPSNSANWFYRSSIAAQGPILPFPSAYQDTDERRVSWMEPQHQFGNNSPVVTPIQSHQPHQTDYFGAYEDKRQRPVSYALSDEHARASGLSPRSLTSPHTQYFELDDTQRSPPVELDTTVPKTKDPEGLPHVPEQDQERICEPNQSQETPEQSADKPTPYSPDDVGRSQSRG